MSVEILHPFSSASMSRTSGTVTLAKDGASKCAEIFVTNNADKWTFFCAYCQKATCDIGAFICHIRLEHLNRQTDLTLSKQVPELQSNVSITIAASLANDRNLTTQNADAEDEPMIDALQQSQLNTRNLIIKEEVIMASEQENSPHSCNLNANKATPSQSSKHKLNEEFFAITAIGQDSGHQQQHKEIVQVVYFNDQAASEKNEINIKQKHNKQDNNDDSEELSNADALTSNISTDDECKNDTYKCPYCKQCYETVKTLNCHITAIHAKKYRLQFPFKCVVCQKGFKSKTSLINHTIAHSRDIRFPCPVCGEKHKKKHFVAHVRTHESDSCFPCQECGKVYCNSKLRLKHWKKHATEKPYSCKICKRRFAKKQYLTHHLKSHNQYQCNFCSSAYNSTETQRPPYVCGKCENLPEGLVPEVTIAAPNPADLTVELVALEHKQAIEIPNNNESITNNTTNIKDAFNNSIININGDNGLNDYDSDLEFINEWHNDNVPSGSSSFTTAPQTMTTPQEDQQSLYKCQYCCREFISERSLICHTSKMHDKNEQFLSRFKCRYCNRTFQTRSGLALHHKTHDKNNQFHCPVCPLTEFRESLFIKHVLQHENETCFPCQVCAKIFSSNDERLDHWRVHIEERPHGCKICLRRFYQKNVLKNHMKSHGLYYCHFCENNFHSRQTLHHPYVCTNCEKLPAVKIKLEKRRSLATEKQQFDAYGEE